MHTDIVIDGRYGDTGKGKVVKSLLNSRQYTHTLKLGGPNCGHTFYHNGIKFATHQIPVGVVNGIKSIIPPSNVLDVNKFFKEIKYLENLGINCRSLIKIDYRCHIIIQKHLEEDSKDIKIGTTKTGCGPCIRDKYTRTGIRAENIPELKPFLVDLYDELFKCSYNPVLLIEGAQGFELDINWGKYPYVTSTHTTVAGALLNGIPHTSIRDVFLVAKAYDTYVGNMKFQPEGEIFNQLQRVGQELGTTTGRPRQCNFLNLSALHRAVKINDATHITINKMDILREVNSWKIITESCGETEVTDLENEDNFKTFIAHIFPDISINFSYSPYFL